MKINPRKIVYGAGIFAGIYTGIIGFSNAQSVASNPNAVVQFQYQRNTDVKELSSNLSSEIEKKTGKKFDPSLLEKIIQTTLGNNSYNLVTIEKTKENSLNFVTDEKIQTPRGFENRAHNFITGLTLNPESKQVAAGSQGYSNSNLPEAMKNVLSNITPAHKDVKSSSPTPNVAISSPTYVAKSSPTAESKPGKIELKKEASNGKITLGLLFSNVMNSVKTNAYDIYNKATGFGIKLDTEANLKNGYSLGFGVSAMKEDGKTYNVRKSKDVGSTSTNLSNIELIIGKELGKLKVSGGLVLNSASVNEKYGVPPVEIEANSAIKLSGGEADLEFSDPNSSLKLRYGIGLLGNNGSSDVKKQSYQKYGLSLGPFVADAQVNSFDMPYPVGAQQLSQVDTAGTEFDAGFSYKGNKLLFSQAKGYGQSASAIGYKATIKASKNCSLDLSHMKYDMPDAAGKTSNSERTTFGLNYEF